MVERRIGAVIFDLDGVVVQTASVHAAAWKRTFDGFLEDRARREGAPFVPFDLDSDYHLHVDGKPRFDGVGDYLASRGICLAEGGPSDPPEAETVHGLGNRKNEIFLNCLREQGAVPYASTVALIDRLKTAGVKVGLVSASRNCASVLASAGLSHLFEVEVDGVESARLDLAGKPAPDIFLEAARRLAVRPAEAAIVEDALAGVEAGRRGRFALVIGVDRAHHAADLKAHGADVVVSDLAELDLSAFGLDAGGAAPVPSALGCFHDIAAAMTGHRPAVFLDYDGTLTPIVARPDLAVLDEAMRDRVRRLAARCPVAVISGRSLTDIRASVGLDALHYAGSHGFEIGGSGGWTKSYGPAADVPATVDAASKELRRRLHGIEGVIVEPKTFAVAVHYRLAAPEDVPRVEAIIDAELSGHPKLKKGYGKKVFELRPAFDWDKGRAVNWLIEVMGLADAVLLPIYIGDDVTDEDAFRALKGRGLGIVVMEEPRPTAADYALRDVAEAGRLLEMLATETGG